jgi:hypothetical protein
MTITVSDAGKLGGATRAASLKPRQRLAIAKKANRARWDKYYLEHPEKIRPKRKRRAA